MGNYFAYTVIKPVHCPNYLVHRKKKNTIIITNRQFRPFVHYPLTLSWEPNSSTRRISNTSVLSRNWLISELVFHSNTALKTPVHEILLFISQWLLNLKRDIFQGNTLFGFRRSKLKVAYPVNYFLDFGAIIARNLHPINYSYLPPWLRLLHLSWKVTYYVSTISLLQRK